MASLSISEPASAYTPAEIDAAAEFARDINFVGNIAHDFYLGRETDTVGSTRIQVYLIKGQIFSSHILSNYGECLFVISFGFFGNSLQSFHFRIPKT